MFLFEQEETPSNDRIFEFLQIVLEDFNDWLESNPLDLQPNIPFDIKLEMDKLREVIKTDPTLLANQYVLLKTEENYSDKRVVESNGLTIKNPGIQLTIYNVLNVFTVHLGWHGSILLYSLNKNSSNHLATYEFETLNVKDVNRWYEKKEEFFKKFVSKILTRFATTREENFKRYGEQQLS